MVILLNKLFESSRITYEVDFSIKRKLQQSVKIMSLKIKRNYNGRKDLYLRI